MNYLYYLTTSPGIVRKIVGHKDVAPYLSDIGDELAPLINYKKLDDPLIKIYCMRFNSNLVGLLAFVENDTGVWVDVAILPGYRGVHAKTLANMVLEDYIRTYKPVKIMGKIKVNNKRSLRFARWCGFNIERQEQKYIYVQKTSCGVD